MYWGCKLCGTVLNRSGGVLRGFHKTSEAAHRERLRYQAQREAARFLALDEIRAGLAALPGGVPPSFSNVGLFEVEQSDVDAVDLVWKDRKVDWDWEEQLNYFKKDPAYWNCALRVSIGAGEDAANKDESQVVLIALSAGSRSNSKMTLRIEGLERKPDLDKENYSWLTALMERAWYNYAISLNCNKITLLEPHDRLIAKYEALGYTEVEDKRINGLSGLSKMLGQEGLEAV